MNCDNILKNENNMKKVVIVSDSHGRENILDDIAILNSDCDLFLHAGDSLLSKTAISPYHQVKGNCDIFIKEKELFFEIEGVRIMMFHGHDEDLRSEKCYEKAKLNNCDIIIHGHTHKKRNERYNDVLILCPGSLKRARDDSESYIVLNIYNKQKINVEFIRV